jgi:carboxylesterase
MRGLALALAAAGLTVELPLLPGHGTDVADMVPTRWEDWSAAAEAAYVELAARCESVAVVGLSMGGTLSVWLGERHPEIAALVLVNPLIEPPDADTVAFIESIVEGGDEVAPGIGSDIALEGVVESAYPESPPVSGDRLIAEVKGPVERIMLERSFHVATLDYDKDEIEARAVKFVTDILPPAGA